MVTSYLYSSHWRALALAAGLLLGLLRPAPAQTLVMGMSAPVTSLDPHFSNAAPNSAIAMHLYDQLVERGTDGKLQPGLAISWHPLSDTSWEFDLRHGVTWQDGVPFTADDVAFSYQRVVQMPATLDSLAGYLRAVSHVEVIDPFTLRIDTRDPQPDLPGNLAMIAIIARHQATGATTEDFNSGKAAVGTGPYQFVAFVPGDRVELKRNPSWWGPKTAWDRVIYRAIANPAARLAALFAGDVDIIDSVSPTDLPRLHADQHVRVVSVDGLRALYLALDTLSKTGAPWLTDAAGTPLPANPLADRRVRQAMSLAINRDALAERTMQGGARANGQFLPAGSFGYDPALAHPAYDLDAARKLMAEAGYKDGFHLTMHGPNDRFFNDSQTLQTVAQMWSRIGITAQVDAMPWTAYASRGVRRQFAISLWAWGNNTGEAGNTLFNVVGTRDPKLQRGSYNNAGYSNPQLDALLDQALGTIDADKRETLLLQAVRMEAEDVAVIHLYQAVNIWAMRQGVNVPPRVDQRTLAAFVTQAP